MPLGLAERMQLCNQPGKMDTHRTKATDRSGEKVQRKKLGHYLSGAEYQSISFPLFETIPRKNS